MDFPETPRTKAQKFVSFLPGGTLYAIRFGIAGTIMLFAFTLPYFTYLMGLTGNITGLILAFLLPCYFHIKLKWDVMPMKEKIADVGIIVAGVFCSIVGTYRKILMELIFLQIRNSKLSRIKNNKKKLFCIIHPCHCWKLLQKRKMKVFLMVKPVIL